MAGTGTILIAAADPRLRSAIARRFTRAGFGTSEYSAGEEAIVSIKEGDAPSLVILDLELTDMSG